MDGKCESFVKRRTSVIRIAFRIPYKKRRAVPVQIRWKRICSERTLVADMQSHETYKIGKASKIILASALFWT